MKFSAKDRQGLYMIGGAVVVMLALFGFKLAKSGGAKPGPDGCIGEPTSNTVIVLDHSEAITDQTKAEITARSLAHVRRAAVNERVTVFAISDISRKSLIPVFSRCKPREDGNRLYESTKGIKKSFEKEFVQPLENALAKPSENGKESPIAQALIDVSLSHYLRGEQNSLLIFSDMMEHTPPKFSLYTCSDPAKTIPQFKESRKGAQERPKFSNAAVYLHVIPRADLPKVGLQCREKLWPWFFGDNEGAGAKFDFDYLPGA